MKSLTIFKPSKHIQLGHMYEHLFCDRIVEYLFENGVYASLDYRLDGRMYHGGVIVIEFAAYTKQAIHFIAELQSIAIEINETTVNKVWNQLESETQKSFGHSTMQEIIEGLRSLEEARWESFEQLDILDLNDVRRPTKPFYISQGNLKGAKSLELTLQLDESDFSHKPELLPLADRIFNVIGMNVQYFLTREMGVYCNDISNHYNKKRLAYKAAFKTYPDFDFQDEYLKKAVVYVIVELKQHQAFERLIDDLVSVPKSQEYWVAPSVKWLYESSFQVVGAKGWKRIATTENVRTILDTMKIEIKYGRQKITLSQDEIISLNDARDEQNI